MLKPKFKVGDILRCKYLSVTHKIKITGIIVDSYRFIFVFPNGHPGISFGRSGSDDISLINDEWETDIVFYYNSIWNKLNE